MLSQSKSPSPNRFIYNGFKAAGSMNDENRPWSLIYSFYHLFMINLTGVTAVLAATYGSENLTEIILSVSSISVYTQVIVKQVVVLTNQRSVRQFLNRLEQYRLEVKQDKERSKLVTDSEIFSAKFIKYYLTFFMGYPFFSFVINFYFDYKSDFKKPHLVFQLYVPWKMNALWPYLAGNIYTALAVMSTIFAYLSFIVLQFLVTFQMSAYLRVLQKRIETNGPRDKQIYYHHKTIIQLIQEYNRLFSGCLYEEAIVSTLQPCGFGYAFIKAIKRYETGGFDMIYKTMMTFSGSFIMCACGEEINTQVMKLHESSYSYKWYEEEPKVRRDIFTMMLVTIRPITVNYRKFVVLNMSCFSVIIRGVYSYLTMIINFDQN